MAIKTAQKIGDHLNIVWTIASKDIIDALKNKVVISMVIMLSLILLFPKLLPFIFEQSQMVLPVYAISDSQHVAKLENNPDISIQKLRSEQELQIALCSAMNPLIGLRIPADFDQVIMIKEQVEFQGYVCWGKRNQVSELQPKLEKMLSQLLDRSVTIHIDGNIVYPPANSVLSLSLATVNSVLLVLMMGIFLVPSLFIEEKEAKTIQALLVSPASISQVVIGKALAGSFYILVTALVIFAISWSEVVHWELVIFFVIGSELFSVAVGLVLGSFFEKQQDIVGWMTALLLFLGGVILIDMLGVELPSFIKGILPWVPSVALAEICRAAFIKDFSSIQLLTDLGIVLAISLPLYLLTIWKVRRSDR